MGQSCKTCQHPQRHEIERLRDGETTLQALADAFGLTKATLNRHFVGKHHLTRFKATEHPPEAAQAVAAVAGEVAASSCPGHAPAPSMRRRAIAHGPRVSVKPASVLELHTPEDRGGEVVPFVRPTPVAVEEPRPEPVPLVKQIADLLELGDTPDDIGYRLSIGGEEMAGYIATIEDAKRTLLAKSAEDWGATLVYSCMSRLARYRRRQSELEAALKHREADRFDAKIVAAERDLRKMLTELGRLGPLDLSSLERSSNGMNDIFSAVKNSIDGVFGDANTSADVKHLRLG